MDARSSYTHNDPTIEVLFGLFLSFAAVHDKSTYCGLPYFGTILEIRRNEPSLFFRGLMVELLRLRLHFLRLYGRLRLFPSRGVATRGTLEGTVSAKIVEQMRGRTRFVPGG